MTSLADSATRTLLGKQLIAREYLRVSRDRTGKQRSTGEQHGNNVEIADDADWLLGDPYCDESLSASRFASKSRGGFEQLVDDLRADEFGADILMLWEASRGSRQVGEWVEMLDLCEKRGVRIYVHTHERLLDPANPRDRKTLLEDAVDAEYESAKMSKRGRRAAAAQAKAGKPSGQTPLGYVRFYDRKTGDFEKQVPDDSPEAIKADPDRKPHAPMVRELFELIVAGHSMRSISRKFEEDGWRNGLGKVYRASQLHEIAARHAYAGLRVWQPGIRKNDKRPRRLDIKPENCHEAVWEGLVSRELFFKVQAILKDPDRATNRFARATHLLSMFTSCGVCGGYLVSNRLDYVCYTNGHVKIRETALDKLAGDLICDFLASTSFTERLAARATSGEELQQVRDELAQAKAELIELGDLVESGEISLPLAGRRERALTDRVNAATERERELSTPDELRGLIEPGEGVAERWAALPIGVQRQVARKLFHADGLLGELRLQRAVDPQPYQPSDPSSRVTLHHNA